MVFREGRKELQLAYSVSLLDYLAILFQSKEACSLFQRAPPQSVFPRRVPAFYPA